MLKVAGASVAAALVVVILIGAVGTAVLGGAAPTLGAALNFPPSPTALTDIPAPYLTLYRRAADHARTAGCTEIDWALLAAVGKVETDHGRSPLPGVNSAENAAGAGGPMQFLAPTFAEVTTRHPPPPGGASPPSRYNPHDAVHAAAAYLCDSGARDGDLPAAVFAYNHSRAYVDHVLTQATTYRATPTPSRTTGAAAVAIEYARGQIGLPYLWGGDGPDRGEAGFDCSGLTTAAYSAAAITIPRTAQTQYNAGPRLAPDQPLAPGDLVFFGTSPRAVTHVGIAISPTEMINAPQRGALVRVDRIWRNTYLGATRPALRTG